MSKKLNIIDCGKEDYQKTRELQRKLLAKRQDSQIDDTLIFVEHPPVYTIGKSGSRDNILVSEDQLEEKGINIYEIFRGGDITYHGPGQIVGYPILNLREHKKDLHWLMNSYEEVFIQMLAEFDIKAGRISGLTGVWVGDEKITALGVGIKRWVTMHGFAFNYDPDLKYFQYIVPCGITDKGVTSLKKLRPDLTLDQEQIKQLIIKYFLEVFDMELITDEQ